MTNIVLWNLGAMAINLIMYAYGRHGANLGCAFISGSFAAAFYFFPVVLV